MTQYSDSLLENVHIGQYTFENSGAFPKLIEERYEGEAVLLNNISLGNLKACIQNFRNGIKDHNAGLLNDIYSRFPSDRLRSYKNATIVLNTLCRVAAKKGGVTPFIVHCISHKYALIIENAPDVEFLLTKVQPFMISDYCLAVQDYSVNKYSSVTKKIATYIVDNLPSPLSVNFLAEAFYLNPSSLSRKFKKETGSSISEFINNHRIKLAQYYFEQGYDNITEVSFLVGYKDSNYFCRIFKKITLITPSQYIKNIKTEGIIL